MRPTLRQLKGFVAAARLNSFSAGARELAMTQPAFSQLIAGLEAGIGLQLFDRTTRRMQLTDAGVQLRAMIERPLDDIDDAYKFLRDIASGKRGRVVFSSVGYGFVMSAIARFKEAFPNVVVTLLDDPSAILISRVLSREVDFGIGALTKPHKELRYRELLLDELVAVFPADHELAAKRRLTWKLLQRQPLVLLQKQSSIRNSVDHHFIAATVAREPEYEVQNAIAAVSMARSGLGITILPRLILSELNMTGLTAAPIFEPRPRRSLGIIARADRPLSAAAAAYVGLIAEEVALARQGWAA